MDLTKGNFRLVFHDIFLIDFFTTLFVVFWTVKNHAWSSKERKELARQRSTLEWSLELPTTKVWKKTERYQVGVLCTLLSHAAAISHLCPDSWTQVRTPLKFKRSYCNSNESFPKLPILYLIYSLTLQVQRTSICNKLS